MTRFLKPKKHRFNEHETLGKVTYPRLKQIA